MLLSCPHCRQANEVRDSEIPELIDCSVCGSTFEPQLDETIDYTRLKAFQENDEPSVRLANFELQDRVGKGAYGSVWRARDTELDRIVAVKIPRTDDLSPGEAEAFLREARAAAQLKHPNIVGVHHAGRDGDTVFIASDFVDGLSLSDWLATNRPDFQQTAGICIKLADALHHAHEHGVVHRDLKPSNIMLDSNGEPYVMD